MTAPVSQEMRQCESCEGRGFTEASGGWALAEPGDVAPRQCLDCNGVGTLRPTPPLHFTLPLSPTCTAEVRFVGDPTRRDLSRLEDHIEALRAGMLETEENRDVI